MTSKPVPFNGWALEFIIVIRAVYSKNVLINIVPLFLRLTPTPPTKHRLHAIVTRAQRRTMQSDAMQRM